MQAVASERWRTHGPYVAQHPGDLAWGVTGPDRAGATALVLDGAYAFRDADNNWSLGGRDALMPELVEAARTAGGSVWALTREDAKVRALVAAGFTPDTGGFWHFAYDLTRDLPPPRHDVTSGATDPDRRVALHQAAWRSTRFTRESYDLVRATPLYDRDLDVVVEWKAYALAWHDERSASGELEPVGTDPAFQRQGYGAAACVAALHLLRERGARWAVVYGSTDPSYPAPAALYRAVGFEPVDRHVRYLPPTRQNAAP